MSTRKGLFLSDYIWLFCLILLGKGLLAFQRCNRENMKIGPILPRRATWLTPYLAPPGTLFSTKKTPIVITPNPASRLKLMVNF